MSTGTRVTGLRQVLRDLAQLGLEVDDFKETFGKISARGASIAAGLVNSSSGRLAGTVRGNRAKNKSVVSAGRSSVRYAGPQNYGWPRRNIKPQRFMQKADEQLQPEIVPMLEAELNDKIRKHGLS